jgi:SacI homology domain
MAASRQFTDSAGKRFSLALISRRSCLHPGMRYIARGLNALASPGNESEVEQIVWTSPAGKQPAMRSSVSLVLQIAASSAVTIWVSSMCQTCSVNMHRSKRGSVMVQLHLAPWNRADLVGGGNEERRLRGC